MAKTERLKSRVNRAVKDAQKQGFLTNPKDILLRAANGLPFVTYHYEAMHKAFGDEAEIPGTGKWVAELYYPTYADQIEAAKAAAPYFDPKLANQTVAPSGELKELLNRAFGKMSDEEIDRRLKELESGA